MKLLVTGGAGFIGSHLVDRLIKNGNKVVVIDNLSTGKKENLNKKAKFYKIDICSPKISQIFRNEKPDIVFHYAAQIDIEKSIKNPIQNAKVNILGSLNILENCREFGIKKFIFASSGGAIYEKPNIFPTPEKYFADPLSPYGIAKLSTEKYLNYYYKTFGLPFISLRYANIYGPRQMSKGEGGVIAIFTDKMLSNRRAMINGDGKQTRDFVYVEDAIEAGVLAMEKNKVGIFNISTAKEINIDIIFKKIKKLTNFNCKKIYSLNTIKEQKRSCLDFQKAKKELEWKPKYFLDKGLQITVNWFKQKNKKNETIR